MPKEGPFLAGLRRILGWLNRLTRTHAAPWLRLRAGQRRPRYPGNPGLDGTQNIQHAVRYTELTPDRFKDFCAFDWQLRQSQDDGWRWSPRLALERYCG